MFAAIDTIAAPLVLAATSTEDDGLNPLVRVVPGLMIWTLLAFVVAMLVLRKYAWPQITRILDQRQTQIEDSIDAAERTRQEADELLAEYRQRLAEARAQADEIVAKAERAGEVAEREALDAAKEKREDLLEQTKRDIQAETQRAIQEIRREVADLTVQATEKVTKKTLNPDDQKRLVEEALAELDFSALSGDRRN
ncbi:F0F1 ATP synthase subunit B [Conexibacter sp. JD483]|uniref:F0F1 ATP synthase subunit B n=1 Tax=unclassified Conexibacter TaxID=2627773 RepID=UPI002723BBFD|nr:MULTISPECIES: F0F1 ATP synthase subunit B [unclassified Conexibacter]MDO8186762.1 F0F1 ATP synthase subunit B [Conexibacter sp. CPCC 205706]MDO8199048.1 F0F1 ATP synthase subunit B [Conexibacter sp. CPCC 205762]MDR9368500.1 F0F1 ATP synthase subunit B [Conexibacter sp. JD483]